MKALIDALMNVSLIMDDAVWYECALSSEADCIVTRNAQDFADAAILVLTPKEFLLSVRQ